MSTRSHFGSLLVQIAHAVARMKREEICCGDLTFQQFETLRVVEGNPGATISAMTCDQRDAIAALYERVPAERRSSVVETLTALSDALSSTGAPIPTKPNKGRGQQ
jgi:hypothetical protein